ncbi:hypothetical protein PsYK624_145770 [Phanerochaete sordida]|uniref:Uncharacterized protein n=1 Tax=Phanerochaete sordida TaxID=48140 RepID=A0A9P3LL60_9APHY|nr:hypothetical protein PsYK624_145770 [Phanerochaete sordida]
MTYSVRNVNGSSNAANDFLQGLPPILIQRFMLNLRQFGQHEMPGQSTLDDTIATADLNMQFRVPSHLLGNIGEPLSFNSSEVDSAKNADGTAAL